MSRAVDRALPADSPSPDDAALGPRRRPRARARCARAFRLLDEGTLAIVRAPAPARRACPRSTGRDRARSPTARRRREGDWTLFETAIDGHLRLARRRATPARAQARGAAALRPSRRYGTRSTALSSAEADGYNLDRRPLVLTLFADLADALRANRAASRTEPTVSGNPRRPWRRHFLHHDRDLLSQRRAAYRPRLRGDRDRRHRPLQAARRLRRVLPHRHGRARPEDAADGGARGHHAAARSPTAMPPQFRAMGEALNARHDRFIRTTEPRHYDACAGDLAADGGGTATSTCRNMPAGTRCATRPITTRARPTSGRTAARRAPHRHAGRVGGGGELLLPALGLPGPAAGALRGRSPTSSARRRAATRSSSFVRAACKDLSISRTTFDWGVPVPGDPKHVMYVWVDALTNYITVDRLPRRERAALASSGRRTCMSSARTSSASTRSTGRPS